MLQSLFLSILLLPIFSFAQLSAVREPNQDYKEILESHETNTQSSSPVSMKGPYSDLNHEAVVEWESLEEMQARFMEIRDERFIIANDENFLRRISWLYPDDGCFARAAVFTEKAEEKAITAPDRIFVFGNLEVATANHPSGRVSWWYHTAPIVRVGGDVYVLDAAINPYEPMLVEDWILKQVPDITKAEVAYCKPYTYSPYSNCDSPQNSDDDQGIRDQKLYLSYEWSRQEQLGREPNDVLGLYPPWLQ